MGPHPILSIGSNVPLTPPTPVAADRDSLFAGREGDGHRAALCYTLIETAKVSGVDPHAYRAHVLKRLPSASSADLDALG